MPDIQPDETVTPSSRNDLGVKGIGEAGTIVVPPTIVNAVLDSLAPLGVDEIDMPLPNERVWETIQSHRD